MDANPIDPIRSYAENLASLDQTAQTLRSHLNSKARTSIAAYGYMVEYRSEPHAFEIRLEFIPSGHVLNKTELLHDEDLTRAIDEGRYTDLLNQIHDRMFPLAVSGAAPSAGEWYEATGRRNGKTMAASFLNAMRPAPRASSGQERAPSFGFEVYRQSTRPEGPGIKHSYGAVWFDTSNGQQRTHIWDGNDWLPMGEYVQKATDEEVNEAIESIKQTVRARPDLLDGHQDS
jgi:hypothetical protein